jgi:hypothetical protein
MLSGGLTGKKVLFGSEQASEHLFFTAAFFSDFTHGRRGVKVKKVSIVVEKRASGMSHRAHGDALGPTRLTLA